jgi:hypothetical protein
LIPIIVDRVGERDREIEEKRQRGRETEIMIEGLGTSF